MNQKENLLYKISAFLKKPTENIKDENTTNKITQLITLFSWSFIVVLGLAAFLGIIISLTGFKGTNLVEELLANDNIFFTILLAVIIAPAIEEVIFRLPLKNTPKNLSISLAVVTVILSARYQQDAPFILLIAAVPLLATLYMHYISKPIIKKMIAGTFSKYYPVIFYSAAIIFGSVHMLNYTNIQSGVAILPLLIIPQTFIGILLGYIRLRYGFIYAVLFHGIYNASLLVPALITSANPENPAFLWIISFYYLALLTYGFVTLLKAVIIRENKT